MIKNQKQISGLRAVLVSSLVSLGDIILNTLAALITGSSVMFAQALQGMADLTTTLLLLVGIKRSERRPNKNHPFGFGRELFFWVLISSLFAFLVSGGIASYRAIQALINGNELSSLLIAIILLTFGLFTNAYALSNSVRRLANRARGKSFFRYLFHSSVVETKMTLLVDSMGTLSAALGLVALIFSQISGSSIYDSIGALVIGLLTAAGAFVVILDLRDLIIGRSPGPSAIKAIKQAALSCKDVLNVLDLRAESIGSGKYLVILEVHFADGLSTDQLEHRTDEIKSTVKRHVQQVELIQVEAESP